MCFSATQLLDEDNMVDEDAMLYEDVSDSEISDTSTVDSEDELVEIPPLQDEWNPTDDDVFAVRGVLHRFVPSELADIVLYRAQYWPCISAKNDRHLGVLSGFETGNNAAAYYLVTPIVPSSKVEMVKFNVISCDQGWGGEARYLGTYDGSWTWFEVGILRNVTDDSVPHARLVKNVDKLNADAFSGKEIINPLEKDRRWNLQRNMQVSSAIREHEVIWRKDDIIDDTAEASARAKGASTGRGFIDTLALGDRIVLVARAQYPGWKNNIYGAKIQVFYSV